KALTGIVFVQTAAGHLSERQEPAVPLAVGAVIAGIACILGHNFPIWLKFKGGKGMATSAGVLIAMMPAAVIVCLLVWGAIFYTTGYVSLASIFAATSLPVVVILLISFTHWLTPEGT